MFLALLRKKPVLWISFSRRGMGTAARAAGEEYLANRSLVTMFTRSSVHWAERIVAISSSKGVSWTSAHSASAYSRESNSATWRARFLLLVAAAGIGQQAACEGRTCRGNRLSPRGRNTASGQIIREKPDSERDLFSFDAEARRRRDAKKKIRIKSGGVDGRERAIYSRHATKVIPFIQADLYAVVSGVGGTCVGTGGRSPASRR